MRSKHITSGLSVKWSSLCKAFIASLALHVELFYFSFKDLRTSSQIDDIDVWFRFLWDIKESLKGSSLEILLLFVSLTLLFVLADYIDIDRNRKRVATTVSLVLSFFYTFGDSFKKYDSWIGVFGSFRNVAKAGIKYIGAAILFYAVIKLLYAFFEKNSFDTTNKTIRFIFDRKASSLFLIGFAAIIICWLPYAYAYWPGLTNYDFFDMLNTYYGIDTNSLRVVIPISETVTLNNNNPVLQVLMAVAAMKIGAFFGSPYIGIAVFCYSQMIVFAAILAYSIVFMQKKGVFPSIILIILVIYCLLPWNPNFALTTLKDTNYSYFTLLFIMFVVDMVLCAETFFDNQKKLIAFGFVELIMMLLRNNGVYVLLLFAICMLVAYRKHIRKILIYAVTPIIIYMILITHIIYPALGISPGSRAEMYSLPIQQIARLINEEGEDIMPEDQQVIASVLNDYDEIAERYDPELADPVKSRFNKYASSEELKAFIKVWAKYLVKYPHIYIQAAICDCYGYFYPEATHWLVYTQIEPPGEDYGVTSPEDRTIIRKELNQMAYIWNSLPAVGLLMSVGFYSWLIIISIGFLIYSGKKQLIMMWLPNVILLVTVIAGPANTMPRYIYPIIISTPLLIAFAICNKETRGKYE